MLFSLFLAHGGVALPPALPIADCANGDEAACVQVIEHEAMQLAAWQVIGQPTENWQWSRLETAMLQYASLIATPEQKKRMTCKTPAPACPLASWQHPEDFADLTAENILFGRGSERIDRALRVKRKNDAIAEGELARVVVEDPEGRPRPWTAVYVYPLRGDNLRGSGAGMAISDVDGTVLAPVDEQGRARIQVLARITNNAPKPVKGAYRTPFVPELQLPPVDGTLGGVWKHEDRELDVDARIESGSARSLSSRVVFLGSDHPGRNNGLLVRVDAETMVLLGMQRRLGTIYSPSSASSH